MVRAASTADEFPVGDALGRVQARTSLTLEPGAPEVLMGEVALVENFCARALPGASISLRVRTDTGGTGAPRRARSSAD